jgi:hypothetical protein
LKNTYRIASMPQRWLAAAIALLAIALAPAALLQAHAQRAEASESGVKAAFIYKFANYIEWPPSAFPAANSPLVIGVAGGDEIGAELERLVPGRTVNGHPVSVKRVKEGEPIRGVHVLFIGRDQAALAQLLRSAQQQSVLTVTDTDRALEMGSAINFVPAGERIAFEVSLDAAEKTGHKISSRMLSVARRVLPKSS